MNEEMKLLLKLLLEQEEETQAGQKVPYNTIKIPRAKKREMMEKAQETELSQKAQPKTEKEFIAQDLKNSRYEMYATHENNVQDLKCVPIWEKYALTIPEASQYFHIGQNRLREIVKKDKYANYLMWNGRNVFIKRKLFEDFLNHENEV